MHEIIYFSSPGLAESSRLCLHLSGLNWKNKVVNWEEYLELKENKTLPHGLLPIMVTSNGVITESGAILRYTGTLAGLEPEDLFLRAKVDEVLELMKGWWESFTPSFSIDNINDKIAARRSLFLNDGPLNNAMLFLSDMVSQDNDLWIAGTDSISIADIKVFTDVFMLFSGQFDGLDRSIIMQYPKLLKYHDKISIIPGIKSYYESMGNSKEHWVYLPGAFN